MCQWSLDRTLLYQAAAFDGIVSAEPLYLNYGTWAYDKDTVSYDTRIFAYNTQIQAFDIPKINRHQAKLSEPLTVLFDRLSRSQLGPIPADLATKSTATAMLNNRKFSVRGLFNLGSSFFLSEGNTIVSEQEAIFLVILGFIPGFIATLGIYQLLTNLTRLELIMTVNLALTVFILTLFMCLISAAIAANKLRAADPADVF